MTNGFMRYKWSAEHRAGKLNGRMWPEGQPLGYVNGILYALIRWETRGEG